MSDFSEEFLRSDFPVRGPHLIAASAGTGKTYNMQNVYARLVMLEGMRISQILVVTFTEAATAELCDRLRRILANVRGYLAQDRDAALDVVFDELDPAQQQAYKLVELVPEEAWKNARENVECALRDFDQAAISTIHGFCRRALERHAFESGVSFATEIENHDVTEMLADDAWRRLPVTEKKPFEKGRDMFCPAVRRLARTGALLDEKQADDEDSRTARTVFSAVEAVRSQVKTQRDKARQLSYDDLLVVLRDALRRPGELLSSKLREEYGAVLIDEFQDTDPVQYEIFQRIFWTDDGTESHPSFVVGDPKQAIYSFRGGDIFTYRKAVEKIPAGQHYELKKNFRSTGGIISAVNRVFGDANGGYAFGDKSIAYDGKLGFDERIHPLRSAGCDDPRPFRVVKIVDKEWDTFIEEVAGQTLKLLNEEKPEIYDAKKKCYRALEASDIAVLVSSNEFGRQVYQSMTEKNVPTVCLTEASVFAGSVAGNLLSFMRLVNDPDYSRQVRGGLDGNVLFGFSREQIRDLAQEDGTTRAPSGWHSDSDNEEKISLSLLSELLTKCSERWSKRGFGAMFAWFAEQTGVYRRLPTLASGERLMTDLGHLLELIQAHETDEGVNVVAETAWFADRMVTASKDNEEEQQRLESDENAVTVVTVHKAKGLEYPVVFVPIVASAYKPQWKRDHTLNGQYWSRGGFKPSKYASAQYPFYHDTNDLQLHAFSRLESPMRNSPRSLLSEKEIEDEHVRTLYVAFTRAAQRCVVVVCPGVDRQCDGLLAKLGGEDPCASVLIEDRAIVPLAQQGRYEGGKGKLRLASPLELPNLNHDEDIGSYSQIAPNHGSVIIAGDAPGEGERDEADLQSGESASATRTYGGWNEEPQDERPLFRCFPGGTDNGSRFHLLFEKLPLNGLNETTAAESVREVFTSVAAVRERINEDEAVQAVVRMIKGVANLRLPALCGPGTDLCLGVVRNDRQMHEWKFDFSSKRAQESTASLFAVIEKHWAEDPTKRILVEAVRQCTKTKRIPNGWMTGSVDLLFEQDGRFYVVDWKTNILGAFRSEFSPAGLTREMARNFYFLQYLIYSAAVHGYLRECVPGYDYGKHFGGVHYVFVRAFAFDDVSAGDAVFSDRPPLAMIEAIGNVFGLFGRENND